MSAMRPKSLVKDKKDKGRNAQVTSVAKPQNYAHGCLIQYLIRQIRREFGIAIN